MSKQQRNNNKTQTRKLCNGKTASLFSLIDAKRPMLWLKFEKTQSSMTFSIGKSVEV